MHGKLLATSPFAILVLVCLFGIKSTAIAQAPRIKILFLGDNGHHQPETRFRMIQPVLAERGIDITYSGTAKALNAKTLARYDGLLIYANTVRITPEQEKALLDYVAGGKGFIPVHCASYCFLNSPKYIALVGARFKSHGTGVFRSDIAEPNHPIMRGLKPIESWDETYVHAKHNSKDRTVLSYRIDRRGKEPWTWIRTHGKGRVFYTAWGHDYRTWKHAGFQNLLERGVRWAVGRKPINQLPAIVKAPQMTPKRKDASPFEYVKAKVPFYPAGKRWGTNTALSQMQLPLKPAESMEHVVHPVQFELKLFVSEPRIKRPLCMNWDEQGRLWIAESVDYPNNRQLQGHGNDRIVICEDTSGDGKADKFSVFADKLSIPTSLTFYNGGIIVQQAPSTLYLKDTNGDGKADERRELFRGWGTRDTHAGPSNLNYGLDNWIWGMVGYSGFRGNVGGENHRFGQGFYRFKPDGSKLEFVRSTNNNSWGVGISEEGLIFGSTANGNPSVYMPIANRYYERVRGLSSSVLRGIAGNPRFYPITEKVRQVDFHGRFTAAAGHALYTARAYPKEYWNRAAFVLEPTGHLVATFQLEKRGSDFRSRNAWNLLASADEWCAPTMAEVGPDGYVWIVDWYNYIVQHNPTPRGFRTGTGNAFVTSLRDKKHGRIYRLVAKGAKRQAGFTLKNATPQKLVAGLKNDNMFWRKHAQRLLVERGKSDVVPALVELVGDDSVDEIGLNAGAIHALWTMHGIGALDGKNAKAMQAAVTAFKHKSAGVRRNAVLVLPPTEESVQAIVAGGALNDADAHVRLAALLALADMPPHPDAGKAIAAMIIRPENAGDRWIPDAVTSAAARHAPHYLATIAAQKNLPPRAVTILTTVAEHYGRGGGKADGLDTILKAYASADAGVTELFLQGLAKGWPRQNKAELKPETEHAVKKLLVRLSPSGKGHLMRLASIWQSKGLRNIAANLAETLLGVLRSGKETDSARIGAAKQFIEFRAGDVKAVEHVLNIITARTPPKLAAGLVEATGNSTATALGTTLVKRLPLLTPNSRAAVLRVLLSRREATDALLDALDKGTVQAVELSLDQKQSLANHPSRPIAARARKILARGGGLPSADRQKVIEIFLPLVKRGGDHVKGKLMFKKHCASCHVHGGEGTKIGPDLTGMAVHPKEELLAHILDPSRNVEGNYRLYLVTTLDGKIFNGMLISESKTTIELFDPQAKKHALQRDNIDELAASNKSVMPEGFEKLMTQAEMVDLLEFLTHRGQFLPLPLAKAATVVSTRGMFYTKDSPTERLIFPAWKPRTFKGVPFHFVDPQKDRVPNVILMYSPNGNIPPKRPKSVRLPCNSAARVIHLLSGVSGWGYPYARQKSVSLIVRLHYADGKTEDHQLINGVHFADYIRRVDVPKSEFAFALRAQQIRYLTVTPKRSHRISVIEFVDGPDPTAPVIMAVTVETK